MEYYRIGEFARRCGTSVEFLKYYDREDLISPVWRDDAGYRYYADYQMVHFAEFYKLSRMGFSTKEAKHIHDGCSLKELEELLSNRRQKFEVEIAEQQTALTYLNGLLCAARHIQQHDQWYIVYLPDSVFYSRPSCNHGDPAKPWWKATPQLPEIWQHVALAPSGNGTEEPDPQTRTWGAFLSQTAPAPETTSENVFQVPQCRCFQYWHSVPADYEEPCHRLSDNVWDLSEPLSIMRQHHLTPRGDLYQRRLFVTKEQDATYVHTLTLIPLK